MPAENKPEREMVDVFMDILDTIEDENYCDAQKVIFVRRTLVRALQDILLDK